MRWGVSIRDDRCLIVDRFGSFMSNLFKDGVMIPLAYRS